MVRLVKERADIVAILAETFRAHGYEGASLSVISEATGLGKGSLYHYFPGGKAEMAQAVLAEIDGWFETHVYAPLRRGDDPARAIADMFASVEKYFDRGGRVCLVGLFALGEERDVFARPVNDYFARWVAALGAALRRRGARPRAAAAAAEDVVAGVQGALVLARALDDRAVFTRALARMQARLDASLAN